jgi:ribosome biogenesis GTPase
VVLTKADLVGDADYVAEDVGAAAPDVEVLVTSTTTGAGIGRLRELAGPGRTLALVGASGHGKSSLVNALVGAELLRARAIRDDGRGRHTSVRRELVVLPGGGAVIDTPGLRGIGMTGRRDGLLRAFADIEALAEHCRFQDCCHRQEVGCAVRVAVDAGAIPTRRYDSWVELMRETDQALARSAGTGRHRARA